jgi:hypothetical protein
MNEHVEQRAFSIEGFAARNGIGRSTAYSEIKEGRLIARKVRGRTLITVEDEAVWRASLPRVSTGASGCRRIASS